MLRGRLLRILRTQATMVTPHRLCLLYWWAYGLHEEQARPLSIGRDCVVYPAVSAEINAMLADGVLIGLGGPLIEAVQPVGGHRQDLRMMQKAALLERLPRCDRRLALWTRIAGVSRRRGADELEALGAEIGDHERVLAIAAIAGRLLAQAT